MVITVVVVIVRVMEIRLIEEKRLSQPERYRD
jgi:hypothetical protein